MNLNDKWDFATVQIKPDPKRNMTINDGFDTALSFGRTPLSSAGQFKALRKGNQIEIEGTVSHNWHDTYNFSPMGSLGGAGAEALRDTGRAKPFHFGGQWKQKVNGTVDIKDGRLTNPQFKWQDIK